MKILTQNKNMLTLARKMPTFRIQASFFAQQKSKPVLLGTILALAYLIPTTILPLWMGDTVGQCLVYGSSIFVSLIFIYLIVKGVKKFFATGFIFIAATLPSIFFAENFSQSVMKSIGWVLLFSIVGPVLMSRSAVIMRDSAWKTVRLAIIIIGIGSFFWYVLRLPNFGRGVFTGITMHSMLLGPMAGMAALMCINQTVERRSFKFAALSLLTILPCMLSGSRSAVLSLLVGVLVLLWISCIHSGKLRTAPIIIGSIFVAALGFAFIEGVKGADRSYALTHALEEKGLYNSRDLLWEARMSEFQESPAFGIGIGMGKGDESAGVLFDPSGSIKIEPGSSYLALLSMTGVMGTLGFALVLSGLVRTLLVSRQFRLTDPVVAEMLAISAFFAVHLIGEGYIYAVGSPLCLIFWLCLGRINDLPLLASATLKKTVRKG